MAISNYRQMPCDVHVMGRNGGQDEQRTPSSAKTEMKASVGCSYLSGGCVVLMKSSFYAGARRGHERRHRPLRALQPARCTTRHGEARTRSWGMCRAMIAVSSGSVVFVMSPPTCLERGAQRRRPSAPHRRRRAAQPREVGVLEERAGELAMAASAQRPWRDGAGGGCRGRGPRSRGGLSASCHVCGGLFSGHGTRARGLRMRKANRNVIALTRNELALPAVLSTHPACARCSPAPPRRPPRASNCPTSVAKDKSCLREEPPQPSLVPWERCPETRPPRLAGCATHPVRRGGVRVRGSFFALVPVRHASR